MPSWALFHFHFLVLWSGEWGKLVLAASFYCKQGYCLLQNAFCFFVSLACGTNIIGSLLHFFCFLFFFFYLLSLLMLLLLLFYFSSLSPSSSSFSSYLPSFFFFFIFFFVFYSFFNFNPLLPYYEKPDNSAHDSCLQLLRNSLWSNKL